MEKIIFEDLPSTNTPINANNLNQLQNNVENAIPQTLNENSTSTTDTYSVNYINNHFGVYTLWTGDIVPTELNLAFGDGFQGDNRPYNFKFCFARFRVYGYEWWFPFQGGVYAEARSHSAYWGLDSSKNAYLTFTFGGYSGFNFEVKETNGIALSDIHLLEIIGIRRI